MKAVAHISGAVSILIVSFCFVGALLGGRYWGLLHSASQAGFFAWMVSGLVLALIATFKGSRWWFIAVATVLASMYLLHPVVFA